jgi:hypothetical protein
MAELTFLQTRDRVLYMLYRLGQTTGKVVLGATGAYDALIFEVSGANELWCERAFDALIEAKHVARNSMPFADRSEISITRGGIELVEAQLGDPFTDMAKLHESFRVVQEEDTRTVSDLMGNSKEQTVLRLLLAPRSTEAESIPAADRSVTVDHNNAEFRDGRAELDKLIDEVRSSNEFSGSPEDKAQAVAELSAVRRLLDATKVRARQLLELAKPALVWIADNFTKETVKELAKTVSAWLIKWLAS